MRMNTTSDPVPVAQLHTLTHDGLSPEEAWIRAERRRLYVMPAAVALTLMVIALTAAVIAVVCAILARVAA